METLGYDVELTYKNKMMKDNMKRGLEMVHFTQIDNKRTAILISDMLAVLCWALAVVFVRYIQVWIILLYLQ